MRVLATALTLTVGLAATDAAAPAQAAAPTAAPAPADDDRYLPEPPTSADAAGRVLDDMGAKLKELSGQLGAKAKDTPQEELAARRFTDAQVLYTFRNYEAAATILLDVVDRHSNTKIFPDALFYLGDALFLRRDYLSARRFLEQFAKSYPQHPRYQEALLRLIEAALHLRTPGRDTPVDPWPTQWLDKLAEIPKDRLQAAGPYVLGKYALLTKQHDRAIAQLAPILPASPFYYQARYLLGAAHVAKGQLEEAKADFQVCADGTARSDEERRVIELAYMALGRIYYEKGDTRAAQEAYLRISQKSDLFIEALYESAWAAIRAKDFKSAQRSLQLLVLARPDALTAPEAKLLIGSLYIRLGEHSPATQWFQRTLEEFEPVYRRVDEALLKSGDAAGYFRGLLAKNLSKFDVGQALPKEAARYVQAEAEVGRFNTLAGDVVELNQSLDEAEETVRRVEVALAGKQRLAVDPEAATVRRTCLRIGAGLAEVRRSVLEQIGRAAGKSLSPEEQAQLRDLAQRRTEVDNRSGQLLGTLGQKDQVEQLRAALASLDKQSGGLAVLLAEQQKARAAVAQAFSESQNQPGDAAMKEAAKQKFQKELKQAEADEQRISGEITRLRADIATAQQAADAERDRLAALGRLTTDTAAQAKNEQEFLDRLLGRLTGDERQRVAALAAVLGRARAVEEETATVVSAANQRIDAKVAEHLGTLQVEKENLRKQRQALVEATGESEAVGGGIYAEATQRTSKRLYDIVVRADVGIIDVAWALKQQRTEAISRMVREQKRELKLLDDEFKEVLKKE